MLNDCKLSTNIINIFSFRSMQMHTIKTGRGKALKTTPVYDSYWKFAAERQKIFIKRIKGKAPPWTNDHILAQYRFTNVYRASDRVSQYLIKNVIYGGNESTEETFFRIILFKIFNKIETWEVLLKAFDGKLQWSTFDLKKYAKVLDSQIKKQSSIYSPAYIMPSPNFGLKRKHRNHLHLLKYMMEKSTPKLVEKAKSLEEVYKILLNIPSLGNFLAFQFAIDLNYSEIIDFSEMEFVVAGPGARSGIKKCFYQDYNYSPEEIIKIVTERSLDEFKRLDLDFKNLWGRSLQLIDCQNLFCEIDKYARIAHPSAVGEGARTRIKRKYSICSDKLPQWYPPKWKLDLPKNFNEKRIIKSVKHFERLSHRQLFLQFT